jgi:hypothetical protein
MIANAISRIIVRVLRWSSAGNAAARLERCPASPVSLGASHKYRDSAARSKPINQSGAPNHTVLALQWRLPNHRAPLKSP